RNSSSGSLGCQVSSGNALAKCATCCPVPLPISRIRPVWGSTRFSKLRIGSLFRSTEPVNQRPSSSFCPSSFSIEHFLERLSVVLVDSKVDFTNRANHFPGRE